jgi:Subtilisin inhibitor-like
MCAVTAAATACGSVAAGSGSAAGAGSMAGSGSAGGTATASAPKVSLDITVTGKPGAKPKHWTLRCDPAGGTHPDPAAACRVLLAAKSPFAPVARHVMCPMIMVGTKTATVKGTWFGTKVDSVLVDGGCTLGRWAKIGQIFN